MILRVQHEDGHHELLTLSGILRIEEGTNLDRIICADGLEHWVTKDGFYDGWSRSITSEDDADKVLNQMEHRRHHEP